MVLLAFLDNNAHTHTHTNTLTHAHTHSLTHTHTHTRPLSYTHRSVAMRQLLRIHNTAAAQQHDNARVRVFAHLAGMTDDPNKYFYPCSEHFMTTFWQVRQL